ncbi:hypothetical protein NHH03_14120 [Stieleria sp. TO1_6]|uniref:hypothetical protein n=1 Tax=Stieleria tagensis TaxID=2956795 RepID=UPI00209AE196|nr:hypothetical protein [Stieleria tagensis]MCO8122880.1 hypothetical protein [Stieleria tagensis]
MTKRLQHDKRFESFTEPIFRMGLHDARKLTRWARDYFEEDHGLPNSSVFGTLDLTSRGRRELKQLAKALYFGRPKVAEQHQAALDLRDAFRKSLSVIATSWDEQAEAINSLTGQKSVWRFRAEKSFAPAIALIILSILSLVAGLNVVVDAELTSASAVVVEGPFFETPSESGLGVPTEPAQELVFAVAVAPVFGLLCMVEFISFFWKRGRRSIFYVALGAIGIPVLLAVTLSFAYVMSGAADASREAPSAFDVMEYPWWYSAISMTGLAAVTAAILEGIKFFVLMLFERAASERPVNQAAVAAFNHVDECVLATTPSLAVLRACIKRHKAHRRVFRDIIFAAAKRQRSDKKRRQLQRRLNDLS